MLASAGLPPFASSTADATEEANEEASGETTAQAESNFAIPFDDMEIVKENLKIMNK